MGSWESHYGALVILKRGKPARSYLRSTLGSTRFCLSSPTCACAGEGDVVRTVLLPPPMYSFESFVRLCSHVITPFFPRGATSEHTDKVLCVDWSLPEYVVSGGADNKLSVYNIQARTAAA